MLAQLIIEKKRDGQALSKQEIEFFVRGFVSGEIPESQAAALAMAVYFQGMTPAETAWLTEAMLQSGERLDLSALDGPRIDKHSSGGVGDKTSLVLTPLLACCGVIVPMISGRGLGITGGTLDKLEAIAGLRLDLAPGEILQVLRGCGCCITGQTASLVPADRKLYALRGVTATVASLPLIVSSIMSKKLAEDLDGLVLDIKVGSGAFMKSEAQALELAGQMVQVGQSMGKRVSAFLTAMDQPLGKTAGNALELKEAVQTLRGGGPKDLRELVLLLGAEMLRLAGKTKSEDGGRLLLGEKLDSGKGFEKFKEMVAAQGGEAEALNNLGHLPQAQEIRDLTATTDGYVTGVAAAKIGEACLLLGAGRSSAEGQVDYAAGISDLVKVGDKVQKGALLARAHMKDQADYERVKDLLEGAIRLGAEPPQKLPLVLRKIAG